MSEQYDNPKGGEQGYEGDGPNLRYDDFVGRIVQDPKEPPSVTLLSGYLGASSEEGHVRLYLDEELCRYVEIPEKSIRHTQELSPRQSPLGGSLVWIDQGAEVLHGAAGSERRKATFLEGQIAQDYIGGAGGFGTGGGGGTTTQTRECGSGGGGILPTDMGPGCGQSQFGPCIPPTEVPGCRTLTGIFCTRFGPGCRKTLFEPNCTVAGPNCRTVLLHQCQSVYNPCVTQNQSYCVASGGVPCNPPIDFTIYEQGGVQQQFAQQAAFGGGGAAGGAQGFAAAPVMPSQNPQCISVPVRNCGTGFRCRTFVFPCPTEVRCPSQDLPCPTEVGCFTRNNAPICQISRVAFCPPNTAVCERQEAVADFGAAARQAGGGVFDPGIGVFQTGFNCPSVFDNCATQESFCPTQSFSCPSRLIACQSQFGDCITRSGCVSKFIRCPTLSNCPSVAIRCPTRGEPRCFASQVAICVDTRAGCQVESVACGVDPAGGIDQLGGGARAFEANVNFTLNTPTVCEVCGVQTQSPDCGSTQSPVCAVVTRTPRCGGGGVGPQVASASFCVTNTPPWLCPVEAGGPGPLYTDRAAAIQPSRYVRCPSAVDLCPTRICPSRSSPCMSQYIRCPSALDACPTRYQCPTLPNGCPGYTQYGSCETAGACPSAVDACPSRFGCEVTQVCQVSQACGIDLGAFGEAGQQFAAQGGGGEVAQYYTQYCNTAGAPRCNIGPGGGLYTNLYPCTAVYPC